MDSLLLRRFVLVGSGVYITPLGPEGSTSFGNSSHVHASFIVGQGVGEALGWGWGAGAQHFCQHTHLRCGLHMHDDHN